MYMCLLVIVVEVFVSVLGCITEYSVFAVRINEMTRKALCEIMWREACF